MKTTQLFERLPYEFERSLPSLFLIDK